jgi:hypothetical protein
LVTGLIVGSANLTISGLSLSHEHIMAYVITPAGPSYPAGPLFDQGSRDCDTLFQAATVIDEAFVVRYAAVRPAHPQPAEDPENEPQVQLISQTQSEVPISQAVALAAAPNLWIDVKKVVRNRGKKMEGNQIDLQRGTRVFFGYGDGRLPKNSHIGTVIIQYDAHAATRNLRFGDNSMDKLDLPIPGREGPATYTNQTLLFTRISPNVYRLQVGNAAEIAEWKAASQRQMTLFRMKGGREYGVFS